MPGDWYYTQNNERRGPVSLAKLKSMAADGWLGPDDLVWHAEMESWVPARDAEGLFPNSLGRLFHKTIAGLRPRAQRGPNRSPADNAPPSLPEATFPPKTTKTRSIRSTPDWGELSLRHLIAACGGFLAALGIAFTVIAQSPVALAFTLSGLFIAAVGLSVELGTLLGQAIENIGKASKEAADRRLRAQELAIEKQRLDLEAARLAQEQAASMAQPTAAAVLPNHPAGYVPAGPGQVVVLAQPPVQRWSPGLAAVLSFFLPGLGQVYKGQIINGIVWFLLVCMGYAALILPGLVLHFFCVLGALSGNPWTEAKTTVVSQ